MRILFEIGHPGQVHLFKYIVRNLQEDGCDVKICAKDRERITYNLLEAYELSFEKMGKNVPGLCKKAITMFEKDYKLFKIANEFKPDLFVSVLSPYSTLISMLMRKEHISFTDSEPSTLMTLMVAPSVDTIITPSGFKLKLPNDKHVRFNGYKELAYLHPNHFVPDSSVLDLLGVDETEKYAILRWGAFDASHDVGIRGFSLEHKRTLTQKLEKYAKVFISSEANLPNYLKKYAIKIPPHRMHDALYYASLSVGDTQTSTTESACLGTPAIRCNSFVGPNDMSNFIELEQKYGLIFNYREPKKAIEKAIELIQQPNLKQEWAKRRERLLKDKIDVTAFISWFIGEYPESFKIMKENPDYQERFN